MKADRDLWWHEVIQNESKEHKAAMDAEDLYYTLQDQQVNRRVWFTLQQAIWSIHYSFSNVFQYEQDDVYWCTADVGWITGHSYIVYGPLLAGATTLMFEGVPLSKCQSILGDCGQI